MTLSVWVRSSLTGTFGGALQNEANTRSYPFSFTVNSANTWEYKTVTIPGDTIGTWETNNGSGIKVRFNLGAGSSKSGAAGAWAGADYRSSTGATSVVGTSGATFYITGVQLEAGSVATPFERRPYGTELALCQRYCFVMRAAAAFDKFSTGITTTGGGVFGVSMPATLRASPTVTYSGIAITQVGAGQNVVTSVVESRLVNNYTYTTLAGGSYTANQPAILQDSGSGGSTFSFSAEL